MGTKFSKNLLKIVDDLQKNHKKNEIEKYKQLVNVGDNLKIFYKTLDGDKERVQKVEGVIIAKKFSGASLAITLRKIFEGIGVEQIFFLNSPKIVSLEKKSSQKVRRAKLYYLRHKI